MYIMNVRYSNEIHLEKEIDPRILDFLFPGMVLQPLIENALRHGLGEVDWEKRIWFQARLSDGHVSIRIRDNGAGISRELLKELNEGSAGRPVEESRQGNGVGLFNVRERLRLYFDRTDVMTIESDGRWKGTQIAIRVPVRRDERKGDGR